MASAINQAAMAAALQGQNHLLRSTEMLVFCGHIDRDTITAQLFIDQIETAAGVANWDNTQKIARDLPGPP